MSIARSSNLSGGRAAGGGIVFGDRGPPSFANHAFAFPANDFDGVVAGSDLRFFFAPEEVTVRFVLTQDTTLLCFLAGVLWPALPSSRGGEWVGESEVEVGDGWV
jgi:hypothetical protein